MSVKLTLIVLLLAYVSYAGDGSEKKKNIINISTEKKYAYGFTKGRYIRRDGKLIYIPGAPKFETRKTGTIISVGNISITEHGISINMDLKKVSRADSIQTDEGHRISLMTSNYHTLNGKRYKVMGTHENRVYFKESKGKDIISAALADKSKDSVSSDKRKNAPKPNRATKAD